MNLFTGKKFVVAGILGALMVFGSGSGLAAENQNAAKSAEAAGQSAGGTSVDAAGAEELAFADAGITAEQAERLRTKSEREDGEAVYEVSFTVDGVEYEYLIREADGAILEWELDGRDVGSAAAEESLQSLTEDSQAETEQSGEASGPIGLERAKEIALTDAGVTAADVKFSKIKFEKDKRKVVYEVEFYQDRLEFEYTIEAYTGEILEAERDH